MQKNSNNRIKAALNCNNNLYKKSNKYFLGGDFGKYQYDVALFYLSPNFNLVPMQKPVSVTVSQHYYFSNIRWD